MVKGCIIIAAVQYFEYSKRLNVRKRCFRLLGFIPEGYEGNLGSGVIAQGRDRHTQPPVNDHKHVVEIEITFDIGCFHQRWGKADKGEEKRNLSTVSVAGQIEVIPVFFRFINQIIPGLVGEKDLEITVFAASCEFRKFISGNSTHISIGDKG